MSTLPIGTYLQEKKYKIEAVLGQGGFGITYLATQEITHERIAIKEFFFKEYCERDESTHMVTVPTAGNRDVVKQFEKKFLKEARMIRQLHHEHIVRVFDVFQENCTSYYAMEYINGRPLSDYIASKGRLAEDEALPIIETVGSALSYLHSQSINHLDIKPANIMLDGADKRVVLIDFGVSKQYDPQSGEGTTTTPVGVSNGYSPLEQYNPGGVSSFSPQSDIYSLAATLLKMLTGQTPPSAIDVSQKGINIPDSVSPNIAQAISLAMQSVKDERPSSIASFLDIIHHGAEGETNITRLHNNPTSKNKKRSWLWLSLLIALIAGIALFFVLSGSHKKNRNAYDDDEETAYVDEDEDEIAEEATEEEEEEEDEDELVTKHYSKTVGDNVIDFEYPVKGNAILVQNIREWINEQLGDTYSGDLNDAEAFFQHYASKLGVNDDEEAADSMVEEYSIEQIKIDYMNDRLVTFTNDSYYYGGGAHGIGATLGVTFRKTDGKMFTHDMIARWYDLQPFVKKGMMKYFEVTTDEELAEYLMYDTNMYNIDNLPKPSSDPWITGEGVVFLYTPYEISYYAAGSPTFTIPYNQIKDALTAVGKSYFE